ncbi:MAG: hypothetical protein KQI62_14070 [Deltaproteobacteria bacterium]|nr:hypothetical protein [Deltaproteobacteria bacterium]
MPQSQRIYLQPAYGVNYEPGLVGFSFSPGTFVSEGITVVTGDEAVSGVQVSHAFLVEDDTYCIEATGQGVVRNHLSHYFGNKYEVYFKRPKGMNPKQAGLVLDAARAKLGQGYSYAGIFGMLMDKVVKVGERWDLLAGCRNPFNSRSTWFCSELVAFALHCLPEYRDTQLLKKWHPSRISPQRLFESDLLESWSLQTPEEVKDRYSAYIKNQETN